MCKYQCSKPLKGHSYCILLFKSRTNGKLLQGKPGGTYQQFFGIKPKTWP